MRFTDFQCFIFISIFSLLPVFLFGQYYNLGQDPASVTWREINSPHLKIIYPENFEIHARKMISRSDFVYSSGTNTLAYKPGKVPVILHTYNTVPNAVTVWAPKRIEMFTCPPQDLDTQDWLTQLMVHEYRHVVQIDRTNQGFTKCLSLLLGEQAATGINGLFVPSWFMEGDAVCTETAFGPSGRGRIPSFEMQLRAQVIQKGAFSYDKAAFGSYKTFVPNQYVLGYSFVANVRRKYGYQAWISALDEVAKRPFILTPFNHGLKKATGFGKEKLYSLTMHEMDSMWKYQDARTYKTPFKQLTRSKGMKYENYKCPHYLNDTLVVSQYSSLDDLTGFVLTGPDYFFQTIVTPGYLSSDQFSVVKVTNEPETNTYPDLKTPFNYLLAWTETINDLRWEQRNYSVIRIFDSNSKEIKSLTSKSRYFAPAFSPDGKAIAAVRIDPDNHNSIVLIEVQNGTESETIIESDSDFYMTPSWSPDGTQLVYTKLDEKGKCINIADLKTKTNSTIFPSTFTELSNPVFANDYVLFNGSFSGIENIYAINLKNTEVFQVTSSQYGASNARPHPHSKKIVYSEYSASGYALAEAEFNPATWKKLSDTRDFSPSLYKYLVKEETGVRDTVNIQSIEYQSKPYKKMAHVFNFHSWAPLYVNYMSSEYGTGISFMSQNELSTATTVIGYKYDMAENTGKVTADFSWMAWYPVIELNTSYGARAAYTGGDSSERYNFNETIISGGLSLPLLFTGGKYYKGLQLKLHTSFYDITHNTSPDENKLTGTIHSLDYTISAYRYIKQAIKDLYPRWGQAVTWSFRHSPFGDNNIGSIGAATARLYLPGLMKHHGIRLDANWQEKNPGEYAYGNLINMPRGYLSINEESIKYFAFNYKFPFAYPDFSLGPIVYLQRLKANLFYDVGKGSTHGQSRRLQSAGIEITSDLHFLRFVFPIDLGVRLGYLLPEEQYFSELLFSVNLSN